MTTTAITEITNLINLAIRSKNAIKNTATLAEADAAAEAAHAAMIEADKLAGPSPRPEIVRQRMAHGWRVTGKAWAAVQERAAKCSN